jgi:ubiquinone/menaquinone biosynthesis C-methylase UbiE
LNSVVEHKVIPYRIATASKCKGDVLEIGAGTGANIDFIAKVDSFSAVEPDVYMRRKLLKTSFETNLDVNIFDYKGENLKFPDNSFDSVFTTLVLCMVTDVEKVVSEAYRVLKPGGKFYFYEHVVSDKYFGHFFQKILNPIWKWGTTGCHLDRDIKSMIETVPFKEVNIEEFTLQFPIRISIPNIVGYAIK